MSATVIRRTDRWFSGCVEASTADSVDSTGQGLSGFASALSPALRPIFLFLEMVAYQPENSLGVRLDVASDGDAVLLDFRPECVTRDP